MSVKIFYNYFLQLYGSEDIKCKGGLMKLVFEYSPLNWTISNHCI